MYASYSTPTRGGAGPYRKGAAFEREVQKYLEAKGWVVVRSPKSGSPMDLLAVSEGEAETVAWFIQCKLGGYLRPKEARELADLAASVGGVPLLVGKSDGQLVWSHIDKLTYDLTPWEV